MKKLLIASNNQGKIDEISHLLGEFSGRILTPQALGLDFDVEESGQTYAENAALKATAYARATGLTALADDTGLEVKVLNGAPGLHSKRFSTHPGATDADRRALLISRLTAYPPPWEARFYCVVAVVDPSGEIFVSEGECRGVIIAKERGHNGFGYDSIFLLEGIGFTMAELDLENKNMVSHRARAVRGAIPRLKTLLNR
jgi:XTP/dITP diphosphohydrolase